MVTGEWVMSPGEWLLARGESLLAEDAQAGSTKRRGFPGGDSIDPGRCRKKKTPTY